MTHLAMAFLKGDHQSSAGGPRLFWCPSRSHLGPHLPAKGCWLASACRGAQSSLLEARRQSNKGFKSGGSLRAGPHSLLQAHITPVAPAVSMDRLRELQSWGQLSELRRPQKCFLTAFPGACVCVHCLCRWDPLLLAWPPQARSWQLHLKIFSRTGR